MVLLAVPRMIQPRARLGQIEARLVMVKCSILGLYYAVIQQGWWPPFTSDWTYEARFCITGSLISTPLSCTGLL
jgi:hypothetical protein